MTAVLASNAAIPVTAAWRDKAKRALTEDMTPEAWKALVAGLVEFFAEEAEEPEHQDDCAMDEAMALDRESVRNKDVDGRLHVSVLNISKATVNPYKGSEIPGWQKLGLDKDKVYRLFRDPDELAKGAATSNGVQILRKHIPVNAEDHKASDVVGAIGNDAVFEYPYLKNSATFWPAADIEGIETGKKKQLSMGYRYTPDMTPGNFRGTAFDGVMREIVVNHVALVEDGRAGPDVVVGDSKENLMARPTQFAATAALLVGTAIRPLLKPKAKVDLMPVFRDLKVETFDRKKFQGALDAALKDHLAEDADPKHLAEVMHHLDGLKSGADKSVSEEQHNAMEAAAHGNSTLGIPESVGKEFAEKDKGSYDNLFMKKAKDWMTSKGMDTSEFEAHMGNPNASDEEEEEPEEVNEGHENVVQHVEDRRAADRKKAMDKSAKDKRFGKDKRADDRRADDKHADDKHADDRGHAMDEAAIEQRVTERLKSKFAAAKFVKPWVGEVDPMAFDSGEAILRHALKAKGCKDAATLHADALKPVLGTYPQAGARPVERHDSNFAMDSGSRREDAEKYAPGLKNIRIGV